MGGPLGPFPPGSGPQDSIIIIIIITISNHHHHHYEHNVAMRPKAVRAPRLPPRCHRGGGGGWGGGTTDPKGALSWVETAPTSLSPPRASGAGPFGGHAVVGLGPPGGTASGPQEQHSPLQVGDGGDMSPPQGGVGRRLVPYWFVGGWRRRGGGGVGQGVTPPGGQELPRILSM